MKSPSWSKSYAALFAKADPHKPECHWDPEPNHLTNLNPITGNMSHETPNVLQQRECAFGGEIGGALLQVGGEEAASG